MIMWNYHALWQYMSSLLVVVVVAAHVQVEVVQHVPVENVDVQVEVVQHSKGSSPYPLWLKVHLLPPSLENAFSVDQ
jgi:hypothetical protein